MVHVISLTQAVRLGGVKMRIIQVHKLQGVVLAQEVVVPVHTIGQILPLKNVVIGQGI
jgi:hypothetical protein